MNQTTSYLNFSAAISTSIRGKKIGVMEESSVGTN